MFACSVLQLSTKVVAMHFKYVTWMSVFSNILNLVSDVNELCNKRYTLVCNSMHISNILEMQTKCMQSFYLMNVTGGC